MQFTGTDLKTAEAVVAHEDYATDAWVPIAAYRQVQRNLIVDKHIADARMDLIEASDRRIVALDRECKVWRIVVGAFVTAFLLAQHWGPM